MSVAEIIRELPSLSLREMKELSRVLEDAIEEAIDLPDVLAVLNRPGALVPFTEIRKKYGV
jgi:hypothetical protein